VRIWRIPDQVVRVGVLVVIAIVALVVVRQMFVPESFGEIGHYRADSIDTILAQDIQYAGMQKCGECHDDLTAIKAGSYHRGLTCEGCHGPSAAHAGADDPSEVMPTIPTGRKSCLRCHDYLPSRPTGFPQIIENLHNPMETCMDCHDPHDPTPPEVPESCSACHAAIARTKAVSHHWSLDCETCHEAKLEHREDPRANLPTKPSQREFCGQCHAKDAHSSSSIPRVELVDHGGRYICWQCHYPHYPEGR